MRRTLFAIGLALVAGCGIGVVGEGDVPVVITPPGDSSVPTPLPEAAPFDGSLPDGDVDAADAAVVFAPTHLGATSYTISSTAISIDADHHWSIDTTALTIDHDDGNGPIASAELRADAASGAAVWSVSSLSLTVSGSISVAGTRPLAIVSAGNVALDGDAAIKSSAVNATPGAGGSDPTLGAGKGANGVVVAMDPPGAGGGGDGQMGGAGATKGGAAGGIAGVAFNDEGVMLVGGSGGGSTKTGTCTRGVGGAGGGAIQISAVGTISITGNATIAVVGGGGGGGCPLNATGTGGGGGGAGGLVYLESVGALQIAGNAVIDARGGGGGEGGGNTANGADATDPSGGAGGSSVGGNGGDGANKDVVAQAGHAAGGDVTGGGGGGGLGRVVLRSRGGVTTTDNFTIHAVRAVVTTF